MQTSFANLTLRTQFPALESPNQTNNKKNTMTHTPHYICSDSIARPQPTHYVTITTRRHSSDHTDGGTDVERVHLKKIVGQLRNNLCNVSVLSDPDLEMLSNMDPNSLADITGKEFMEQLKEVSGRSGRRYLSDDASGRRTHARTQRSVRRVVGVVGWWLVAGTSPPNVDNIVYCYLSICVCLCVTLSYPFGCFSV